MCILLWGILLIFSKHIWLRVTRFPSNWQGEGDLPAVWKGIGQHCSYVANNMVMSVLVRTRSDIILLLAIWGILGFGQKLYSRSHFCHRDFALCVTGNTMMAALIWFLSKILKCFIAVRSSKLLFQVRWNVGCKELPWGILLILSKYLIFPLIFLKIFCLERKPSVG